MEICRCVKVVGKVMVEVETYRCKEEGVVMKVVGTCRYKEEEVMMTGDMGIYRHMAGAEGDDGERGDLYT
jgi:hypothetical protein